MGFQIFGTDHLTATAIDEPCVHCGEPIADISGWMHVRGPDRSDRTLWPVHYERRCADGSGHVACPAQGGFE